MDLEFILGLRSSISSGMGFGHFLSKPGAYITHNATCPLNDITGGTLWDYMQLLLEPQKALRYFFFYFTHMQFYSTKPVNAF